MTEHVVDLRAGAASASPLSEQGAAEFQEAAGRIAAAVNSFIQGKAEVVEELDRPLRAATDTYPWPHVIRLVHYVRVPRIVQRKISRRALFARDNWRCVYCGTAGGRLTLDHVVPRSRGGDSTWENVVTSCAPCNRRKGNSLPRQVGMKLLRQPRTPSPHVFIQVASPTIPAAWQQYLAA